MLYKAIAIILSTLLLATVQMSTASASCGGGHGGFRVYQPKVYHRPAVKQSRARPAHSVAAAKPKKTVQQARAEQAEPAPIKEETKQVVSKDAPENKLAVASVDQTCTKFIAAPLRGTLEMFLFCSILFFRPLCAPRRALHAATPTETEPEPRRDRSRSTPPPRTHGGHAG